MNREAETHGSATEASMVLAVSFRNSASYCLFSSSIKDRQSGGLFDAHGHQKRRTRGVVEDTVREAKPCRARSRRSQKSTAPSAPAWLLGSSSGWRRGAGRLKGRRRRGVEARDGGGTVQGRSPLLRQYTRCCISMIKPFDQCVAGLAWLARVLRCERFRANLCGNGTCFT